MSYGIGGSVGASAASGLQAGFGMGLAATAQNDARKQRDFENQRQTTQDQQRTDQLSRSNAAADKASAEHDDDRAMVGHVAERDDLRYQLGAARAASPDGTLSRDVADPLYAQIQANHGRISALNAKKAQPIIDATQQKWRDFASKAEAGQADPSTLRGQDLRDFIKANTGHDLADFANGKVGGAIDDATAGMQGGNMSLAVRAAGTLLKPHINQKLGGPAADGSMIVDKDLYALVPAPAQTPQAPATPPLKGLMDMLNQSTQPGQNASVQPSAAGAAQMGMGAQPPQPGMQPDQQAPVQPSGPPPLQPGTDPNLLMPVLDVTTRQPDGTLTKYHAPVTQDRSADPGAPHAQPLKMTDLTDRMGRLGVLDKWLKQPEMQDAVKEALASKPTSYEQMWAMVHGDPTNLTGDGAKDATSLKIAAGKKLAKELGVPFADAMRQITGKSDAAGGTTPGATGQSIAAIQKLADEKYGGNFTAAAQALKGHVGAPDPTGGVSGAAPAPSAAGSGVGAPVAPAEQQARDAEGLKIMQGERPRWEKAVADAKTSGNQVDIAKAQGDLDAFNRGVTRQEKLASAAPATGIKPVPATSATASAVLGGTIAPTGSKDETVDFWAHAVIAGDKDWQIGLGRSKSGSALIEAVKRRVPGLAKELGLEPQDMGTARAQSAALGGALKDLTKRSEAVDLFSSKVEKDMKTYDAALTKAGSDSPLLINKPINMLRRQFSDSDLAKLDLAAQQVGTEYERLITGGTLSVAQLHAGASADAKKLINGDMPPKQARAIMEIMRVEMQNARDAAHESTVRMNDKIRNLGRGSGPAAGPALVPGGGAPGITGSPAAASGPKQIATDADYHALPSGALFVGPDGKPRRKP